MAEQTLDGLAGAIARRYGYYVAGTATSGSTTTLMDPAALIQPDNTWINHYVHLITGSNAGLERLVTVYGDATLNFNSLPNVCAAGDRYEVSPLQRADIVQAIQDAIGRAGQTWMCVVDDDGGSFTPGVQEYDLPADLVSLLGVYMWASPDTNVGEWQPLTNYEVLGQPGARKLLMRGWGSYVDPSLTILDYRRRIRYMALPALLSAGADTLAIGETAEREALAYIEEFALGVLHEMAWARNKTGEAARADMALAQQHYSNALQIQTLRKPLRETRYMRTMHIGRQR